MEDKFSTSRRRFVAAISATGLTGVALGSSSVRAQARPSIVITQAVRIANYTPVYVALREGLFSKHGLDVQIKTAGGIAVVVPVLLSGQAQFAVSGTAPALNSTVEGGRMKCIAKVCGGTALVAVAKSGLKLNSLDDFKGKTIATLKFPSNTLATPQYVLSEIGKIDLAAAGIKFLQLPAGAQLAAVKDGRADLAVVFEWDASIAVTQFGLSVAYRFTDLVGPNASSTVFVTQEYLDGHADTVQRFVDALAESMKLIQTDSGVYARVSQQEFPEVSPAAIKLGAANLMSMKNIVPRNPTITEDDYRGMLKIEAKVGSLRKPLPFSEMVDNHFAEQATARYGLAS
jgi:NitT/TauT family transport system substrate-binding protein